MTDRTLLIPAILLGVVGVWLMLPRGRGAGRGAGIVLGAIALGLGFSRLPGLGSWLAQSMFLVLAVVTVASAAAAVTFRNPVYCAVWFGLSLLGTAGLFLFAGAQFLAVATVVVYAGAILVTFLFVLMLAQPEGRARYDRVSWEPPLSAAAGVLLVGVLSAAIGGLVSPAPSGGAHSAPGALTPPSAKSLDAGVLAPEHVARLGSELFGRHLIAVELAGVLLLVALVGAAVIVAHGKQKSQEVEWP
jgi:NADH-quinone oxidoreductase subunit J